MSRNVEHHYKVEKVRIRASPKDVNRLYEYNRQCGNVWNDCLDICNEHYEETGEWFDQYQLQRIFKTRDYGLPSHVKQQVLFKYKRAQMNIALAIRSGRTDLKYPHKRKKYFNSIFDYQNFRVDRDSGCIHLSTVLTKEGKRQPRIKIYLNDIPSDIKQIEITYNNGLYACLTYIDHSDYTIVDGSNIAAIDLGEIHAITATDLHGNAICITGRKLRSIKYFRNKKHAQLRSSMSKCINDSIRWRKYNQTMQHIRYKSKTQQHDCLHKISKLFVDYAVENNISAVYIGDVEGVERNTKGKRIKIVTQKLSQWEFGKLTELLTYKLNQHNIVLAKVNEAYTSQTCPVCGSLNKPKGRNYECSNCGHHQHRDVVGAINILKFNTNQDVKLPTNIKYLRIQ
jgi:putative transposase